MCLWWELSLIKPHWPHIRGGRFGGDSLLAYRLSWLLANQSSHFVVERRDNIGQPFHPSGRPARGHIHLHGILVAKQSFSQGAVESFNYGLISVDIGPPTADGNIVLAHSIGHSTHKLTPRVDLQHLRPLERPASVYLGKASRDFIAILTRQCLRSFVPACHIHNRQGVLVNLLSSREFVMGQEEKVGLVDCIGQRDIEVGSRDVAGPGEVNLP